MGMTHDIQAAMKRIEVIDATMRYCPSKPKTCELCRNLRAERDRQEAYLSDLRADQREQHTAMIEAMNEGNNA